MKTQDYIEKLKSALDSLDLKSIEQMVIALDEARERESNIFVIGNGGSAATASHMACDFSKDIPSDATKKRFKIFPLADNTPTMMAYANDVSYDVVFSEMLKNFLRAGDVVFAISGSGNSVNVIKAAEFAKSQGALVLALTGFDGGKLKDMADCSVCTNVNDMQISEDVHLAVIHMMRKLLS